MKSGCQSMYQDLRHIPPVDVACAVLHHAWHAESLHAHETKDLSVEMCPRAHSPVQP